MTGSDLGTPPNLSTTATQFTLIGTYPITCSGGVDVNYTFTYVAGTLTITTAYTFTGFFSPIDNPPLVNQANVGRTIPTKWRLTTTSGVAVSDPSSFVSLTSRVVTCGTFSGTAADDIETYIGQLGPPISRRRQLALQLGHTKVIRRSVPNHDRDHERWQYAHRQLQIQVTGPAQDGSTALKAVG